MAEPPRGDESQSLREARVLKSVLEADIVPENKIGKVGQLNFLNNDVCRDIRDGKAEPVMSRTAATIQAGRAS